MTATTVVDPPSSVNLDQSTILLRPTISSNPMINYNWIEASTSTSASSASNCNTENNGMRSMDQGHPLDDASMACVTSANDNNNNINPISNGDIIKSCITSINNNNYLQMQYNWPDQQQQQGIFNPSNYYPIIYNSGANHDRRPNNNYITTINFNDDSVSAPSTSTFINWPAEQNHQYSNSYNNNYSSEQPRVNYFISPQESTMEENYAATAGATASNSDKELQLLTLANNYQSRSDQLSRTCYYSIINAYNRTALINQGSINLDGDRPAAENRLSNCNNVNQLQQKSASSKSAMVKLRQSDEQSNEQSNVDADYGLNYDSSLNNMPMIKKQRLSLMPASSCLYSPNCSGSAAGSYSDQQVNIVQASTSPKLDSIISNNSPTNPNTEQMIRPTNNLISASNDTNKNTITTTSTTSNKTINVNNSAIVGRPRAKRGSATDPQSIYARQRRERINERLKVLQNLVPNGAKVDIVTMLEEAISYVKFLQLQVKLLSSDEYWMYAPTTFNGIDVSFDMLHSSS